MSDKYAIDSHKLSYHPERVARFLEGELVYPIYMELSPSGGCNHRCRFCALDYLGYQKRLFDTVLLKKRLDEMGKLGVKSIMYAGEGEPFLHPEMVEIAQYTKQCGIDVAFTTNGAKIRKSDAKRLLECSTFIKVSINAGTCDTYKQVHRAPRSDFDHVMAISSHLVETRRRHGLSCTIGWQMLLLPETRNEASLLARRAKEAGVDYLVIKPFSKHPKSANKDYADLRYERDDALAEQLAEFNDDRFNVIYRRNAIEKSISQARRYDHCCGVHFWAYVDTAGNVWGCIPYIGDKHMYYGNLNESTFKEIWTGDTRRAALRHVEDRLDINSCRVNCRMDKVNEYLWDLKHPSDHVNFI